MIATLNDQFRRTSTRDIYFAGELAQRHFVEHAVILGRVRHFKDEEFDEDCPEHDFLAFDYGKRKIFAKIDCYDKNLEWGLDPLDPECRRVLTIFFAEDY